MEVVGDATALMARLQADLVGAGAGARAELGQDVRDVDRHGLGADEQLLADLAVGPALGDEGEDRVRAAFGAERYDRLARIKAEYDPDNIFRPQGNITPA